MQSLMSYFQAKHHKVYTRLRLKNVKIHLRSVMNLEIRFLDVGK